MGLMVRKLILTRWVSVERFRHYLLFSTHLACRPLQGPARPTGNCAATLHWPAAATPLRVAATGPSKWFCYSGHCDLPRWVAVARS